MRREAQYLGTHLLAVQARQVSKKGQDAQRIVRSKK